MSPTWNILTFFFSNFLCSSLSIIWIVFWFLVQEEIVSKGKIEIQYGIVQCITSNINDNNSFLTINYYRESAQFKQDFFIEKCE